MDIGSQHKCVSVMAESLKITTGQCVEYHDLQNRTNLAVLEVSETSMQYFPEGDCSSTAPDEEVRVLNLPIVHTFTLRKNKLLKMPNISSMRGLSGFTLEGSLISSIPGKPFINNNRLTNLNLGGNQLVHPPDLDGSCGSLLYLLMPYNDLTYFPQNYFNGCTKLRTVHLPGNQITSFPNFAPIGSLLRFIQIHKNHLNETIPKDAIAMHPNLRRLYLHDNQLPAFIISFCNLKKQLDFNADNNRLVTVKNPYRDCIASIGTLPKPKFSLKNNQLLPCDEKICWMKEMENLIIGDCPDGREWKYVTKEELCPGNCIFFG